MSHHSVLALVCLAISVVSGRAQELQDIEKEAARNASAVALRGRTVRVSFGKEENPYLLKDSDGTWRGVLKDIFDQFQAQVGFVPVFTEISEESRAAEVDRNTACVRDISLNRTDLCVGNAWVTPERIGYAQALPTMWQENFQVGVKWEPFDWKSRIFQAFAPFSPALWSLIVTFIILLSLGNCLVEAESNNRDFLDKDSFNAVGSGLYYGFKSFFWSEPVSRPVTAEGKILMVGLGFFTLIMLSSYTASLASLMVATSQSGSIQDLESAIVQRMRVCMYASLLSRAKRAFPQITWLYVEMDTVAGGYQKMAAGECDVILVDSVFHAVARAAGHCNRALVGSSVMSINCAWFAAEQVLSPMSFFFADLMSTGVVEALKKAGTPSNDCAAIVESDEETVGLYISDVSGVFFIIAVFGFVAGLVHLGKRFFRYGKARSSTLSALAERVNRSTTHTDDSQPTRDFVSNRRSVREDGGMGMQLVRDYCVEQRMRNTPYERALVVAGARQTEAMTELLKEVDGLTYIYDV